MGLIRNKFSLRKKDWKETLFLVHIEKNFLKKGLAFIFPLFVLFAVVDAYVVNENLLVFFMLRTLCCVFSYFFFLLSRSRLDYPVRTTLTYLPFALYVQIFMLHNNLILTPYYLGTILIMFPPTIFFPQKTANAFLCLSITFSPTIIYLIANSHTLTNHPLIVLATLMLMGSISLLAMNSAIFSNVSRSLVEKKILLKNHLKNRNQEIAKKVSEISKRKSFEMQFSPQVVKSILSGSQDHLEMQRRALSIVIFDVVNSTKKSAALSTEDYRYVVEDIFDLIGSICLKWNLTLDKFTGDGAQTFAGSPVSFDDDFYRSIKASLEIFHQLSIKNKEWKYYWKDPVEIRIGICLGDALVGFFGRGSVKSYTAIGPNVSLAHRLCGFAQPNEIAIYSKNEDSLEFQLRSLSIPFTYSIANNLKGFESAQLKIFNVKEEIDPSLEINCPTCSTPLILQEDKMGIPKVICTNCAQKAAKAA